MLPTCTPGFITKTSGNTVTAWGYNILTLILCAQGSGQAGDSYTCNVQCATCSSGVDQCPCLSPTFNCVGTCCALSPCNCAVGQKCCPDLSCVAAGAKCTTTCPIVLDAFNEGYH